MKICEDYKKKIEEEWEEPIRRRKEARKRKCRRASCNPWLLCLNKLACYTCVLVWWITEWVVRILVKWVVYVICRILTTLVTLLLLIGFLIWFFWCSISERQPLTKERIEELSDIRLRSTRTLNVEVVIIDKDGNTRNPITEAELDARIADADRVFQERARIRVKRRGNIHRSISASLYNIDATGFGGQLSEYLKGPLQLMGRDSPKYLTIYAVGNISGFVEGVHQPLFGSIFVRAGNFDLTIAHELAHALLAVNKMGHSADIKNLMYATPENEAAVGWPRGTPQLTVAQWCSMRQSRWLDWTWSCERCP